MNWSTFCEIKYMNRHFFSNEMYMIGVDLKKMARTHVPKLPRPPHPPPEKSMLLVLVQLLI